MTDDSPVGELMDSGSAYDSELGSAYHGDSRELLAELPDESIDLIVTSPPFALQHEKDYGNEAQDSYNDWFMEFVPEVRRVLAPHGSFVIELGGAFKRGWPERSTYQFELLTRLTDEDEGNLKLAQDFYWFNPAKLPSPIEWVNVRKIRVTDAVTHIWWLSKDINKDSAVEDDEAPIPEASNQRVLQEYSDSQKNLIKTGEFNDGKRGSGHDIDPEAFANENDGAIPKNLIQASNTASNTHYLQMCRQFDFDYHPARFPRQIPEFFVKFLTPHPPYDDWDRGYLDRPVVLDIFGGSNLTGKTAEDLDRYWMSFEQKEEYVQTSQFRFLKEQEIRKMLDEDQSGLAEFAEADSSD
jgi:site-specific DNA-methyltransferase (cytosine-N4-specific)